MSDLLLLLGYVATGKFTVERALVRELEVLKGRRSLLLKSPSSDYVCAEPAGRFAALVP